MRSPFTSKCCTSGDKLHLFCIVITSSIMRTCHVKNPMSYVQGTGCDIHLKQIEPQFLLEDYTQCSTAWRHDCQQHTVLAKVLTISETGEVKICSRKQKIKPHSTLIHARLIPVKHTVHFSGLKEQHTVLVNCFWWCKKVPLIGQVPYGYFLNLRIDWGYLPWIDAWIFKQEPDITNYKGYILPIPQVNNNKNVNDSVQ